METGGRTRERLEMVAPKVDNYTMVIVDEVDSPVAQIDWLCLVYFQHYHLMLPQFHLGVVVSPTAHPLEPHWLPSAENQSSTSDVNKNRSIQIINSIGDFK